MALNKSNLTVIAVLICLLFGAAESAVRITQGQQLLYAFNEGSGTIVHDTSGIGSPFDLTIQDTSAVAWRPGGGLIITSPTIIKSPGVATKLIQACKQTNELTVEAWIKPANNTQNGPARIITLSSDLYNRNFTIAEGLWGTKRSDLYLARLRTTATNNDGMPEIYTAEGTCTTNLTHLVYVRDSQGNEKIYINNSAPVLSSVRSGNFSNWSDFNFGIANELTGDRPWLGEVYLVCIFNRALTQQEVTQNFEAGPGGQLPPPAPVSCDDLETGYTLNADIGNHPDWFDGDDNNGSDIQSGIGVAGSIGLAPSSVIFTWTANPFHFNDPNFLACAMQMDFKTDGSGNFDDDRIGWMISDTSTSSVDNFGVQLDHLDGGIVTYWRNSDNVRYQEPIVELNPLKPNTWYQFYAKFTKLTDLSVSIEVILDELDISGQIFANVASGFVADTSGFGADAPDARYFTAATMWPAFKNHSQLQGAADNPCFDLLMRSDAFAFVVVTDVHLNQGYQSNVENNLQQIRYWIDNPTTSMPAPQFMVISGDFPNVSQTQASIDSVIGSDFLWYPVIGNHEISDDINNFFYIRDTLVSSLPNIVNYGPQGSLNSSYSWTFGDAHFVAINAYWNGTTNTGGDYASAGDIPVILNQWIASDLSASNAWHSFAFVHEPAYPDVRHIGDSLDAYPTNRDAFVSMLANRNVAALFSGHTHYYNHVTNAQIPLVGSVDHITNAALRNTTGDEGATITYVLVDGFNVTFRVYHSQAGYPFSLLEQWTTTVGPPTGEPAAPANVLANIISQDMISISWQDMADNEIGFELERSVNGGSFEVLELLPADAQNYDDTDVVMDVQYCYRIRAFNDAGVSDFAGPICKTISSQPPTGACEDFDLGFAIGSTVGSNIAWYDGGSGPVVTSGIGIGSSVGLAGANNIFTWLAYPFSWNAFDFEGISVQMDFQTNASGNFDDDRVGWMISDSSTSSDNNFGVQLDHTDGGIVTYWRNSANVRYQEPIAALNPLKANTWYRFNATFTKITATSAAIDVLLDELNASGQIVANVASGSIPNTDDLGSNAPASKYFTTATIWPAFKNFSAIAGAADNACVEVFTSTTPTYYVLNVTSQGNGQVTKNPDQADYPSGQTVLLSAIADTGWEFAYWSGDISSKDNPATVLMTGNKSVTAVFEEIGTPPSGECEDFNSGYTLGSMIGSSADWYDGGNGPVITSGVGTNGSVGLGGANNIFTWLAQPFSWSASNLEGVSIQMDFKSNSTGVGDPFNDDRVGWMIYNNSVNSDHIFGVQLDRSTNAIEGYWEGATGPDRRPLITTWSPKRSTWYRLTLDVTKLTSTSARIDVTVHELNNDGSIAVSDVAGGTIADTSALGDDRPDTIYFTTPTMWPAFKNFHNTSDGPADNACFEIFTTAPVTYVLNVTPEGNGQVTKDPDKASYAGGETVWLTAIPDAGWEFAYWTGDIYLTDNPTSVTIADNMSVTAVFEQIALPTITVLHPNGGETFIAGNVCDITWSCSGNVGDVIVEYSLNNGSSWIEVDPACSGNSGLYNWTIPNINSNQCQVRLLDSASMATSDTSDLAFTVFVCNVAGDLTGDCYVDFEDFAILAADWLICGNSFDPDWCLNQ